MEGNRKPKATTDTFWRTALHEAGHVICACALGAPPGAAMLMRDDDRRSGLAYSAGRLPACEEAIVTAAGRAAEALADTADPLPAERGESTGGPALPASLDDAVREDAKAAVSDDRHIALWAITGYEHDESSWSGRGLLVRREAEALVADHREAIILVASHLYQHGIVAPSTLAKLGLRSRTVETGDDAGQARGTVDHGKESNCV